ATTSFPVPVSPRTATEASLAANRAAFFKRVCIASLRATTFVSRARLDTTGIKPQTSQIPMHCSIRSNMERELRAVELSLRGGVELDYSFSNPKTWPNPCIEPQMDQLPISRHAPVSDYLRALSTPHLIGHIVKKHHA